MSEKVVEVLRTNLNSLKQSIKWLERSYEQCKTAGVKNEYTEEEFDRFENLTSRYARTADLLINKVFRSIDVVEYVNEGTMLDALNRAEKRGIIASAQDVRPIKDLRNDISHEYETDDLGRLFADILAATPKVFGIAEKTFAYCEKYCA